MHAANRFNFQHGCGNCCKLSTTTPSLGRRECYIGISFLSNLASLPKSFGRKSAAWDRHGKPGGEGEQSAEGRQDVRPDLHRLVLAGQADHPANAAVARGRDPQEEREGRLRPRGTAERSSAGPHPPVRPMRSLQQQQLIGLYF